MHTGTIEIPHRVDPPGGSSARRAWNDGSAGMRPGFPNEPSGRLSGEFLDAGGWRLRGKSLPYRMS